MTKNHILIKSIALGVLLMLSPTAKAAGGVDQVLVAYFKKLHVGASPKCSVDDMTKTRILSEIEPKCLIRTVQPEGSYISGVKSGCSEASVKTAVDTQVNALCENTAFKADQAAVKQQQATAEAARQAEAKKAAGGGGGSGGAGQALKQASQGLKLFNDISSRDFKRNKTKAEAEEKAAQEKATKESSESATASTTSPDLKTAANSSGNNSSSKDDWGPAKTPVTTDTPVVAGDGKAPAEQKLDTTGNGQPGDAETIKAGEQPKIDQAKKQLAAKNPEAGAAAEEADKPAKPEEIDPEYEARHAKSKAEDEALMTKLQTFRTRLNAAIKQIGPDAVADCTKNEATRAKNYGTTTDNTKMEGECTAGTPQQVISCIDTNFAQVEKDAPELKTNKESCSNTSAQAEKLCSMVRSEKAQNVQKLMSVGATVLSKITAASDACGTTSDLSKVAQGGMLLAQGSCTAMKYRCDFSCAGAKKKVESMKTSVAAALKCGASKIEPAKLTGQNVDRDLSELEKLLSQELNPDKSVPTAIAQCIKHKADIAIMGLSALGFLSAFQDAQACKKQLAAGGDGGAGKSTSGLAGPNMTTAEYCSMPNNAASITCKCTTDPNADGCMGSLAKSGVNIGKIGNNGGASAFASAGQNGLGSLNSMSKDPTTGEELPPGANLSEAAREALGMGSAVADSAGGGAAAGMATGSNAEAAKKGKLKEDEKPKFGFFSSLGNMLSGGKKPDHAAKATIRKYEQDQAIKRKLASDQVRAEISTASGKSNFDKIRSRYQQNAASFEQ